MRPLPTRSCSRAPLLLLLLLATTTLAQRRPKTDTPDDGQAQRGVSTRGRARFTQTPEFTSFVQSTDATEPRPKSTRRRLDYERPSEPRQRIEETSPLGRSSYEVKEVVDDIPREEYRRPAVKPKVISEVNFEAKSTPKPEITENSTKPPETKEEKHVPSSTDASTPGIKSTTESLEPLKVTEEAVSKSSEASTIKATLAAKLFVPEPTKQTDPVSDIPKLKRVIKTHHTTTSAPTEEPKRPATRRSRVHTRVTETTTAKQIRSRGSRRGEVKPETTTKSEITRTRTYRRRPEQDIGKRGPSVLTEETENYPARSRVGRKTNPSRFNRRSDTSEDVEYVPRGGIQASPSRRRETQLPTDAPKTENVRTRASVRTSSKHENTNTAARRSSRGRTMSQIEREKSNERNIAKLRLIERRTFTEPTKPMDRHDLLATTKSFEKTESTTALPKPTAHTTEEQAISSEASTPKLNRRTSQRFITKDVRIVPTNDITSGRNKRTSTTEASTVAATSSTTVRSRSRTRTNTPGRTQGLGSQAKKVQPNVSETRLQNLNARRSRTNLPRPETSTRSIRRGVSRFKVEAEQNLEDGAESNISTSVKVMVEEESSSTRGARRVTSAVSETKHDEEIDESDNYPEPFKALIQAKKETRSRHPTEGIKMEKRVTFSSRVTTGRDHRKERTDVPSTTSIPKRPSARAQVSGKAERTASANNVVETTLKPTLQPPSTSTLKQVLTSVSSKVTRQRYSARFKSDPEKVKQLKQAASSPRVHSPTPKPRNLALASKITGAHKKSTANLTDQARPAPSYKRNPPSKNTIDETNGTSSETPALSKLKTHRFSARYRGDGFRAPSFKSTTSPAYVPTVPTVTPGNSRATANDIVTEEKATSPEIISLDEPVQSSIPSASLVTDRSTTSTHSTVDNTDTTDTTIVTAVTADAIRATAYDPLIALTDTFTASPEYFTESLAPRDDAYLQSLAQTLETTTTMTGQQVSTAQTNLANRLLKSITSSPLISTNTQALSAAVSALAPGSTVTIRSAKSYGKTKDGIPPEQNILGRDKPAKGLTEKPQSIIEQIINSLIQNSTTERPAPAPFSASTTQPSTTTAFTSQTIIQRIPPKKESKVSEVSFGTPRSIIDRILNSISSIRSITDTDTSTSMSTRPSSTERVVLITKPSTKVSPTPSSTIPPPTVKSTLQPQKSVTILSATQTTPPASTLPVFSSSSLDPALSNEVTTDATVPQKRPLGKAFALVNSVTNPIQTTTPKPTTTPTPSITTTMTPKPITTTVESTIPSMLTTLFRNLFSTPSPAALTSRPPSTTPEPPTTTTLTNVVDRAAEITTGVTSSKVQSTPSIFSVNPNSVIVSSANDIPPNFTSAVAKMLEQLLGTDSPLSTSTVPDTSTDVLNELISTTQGSTMTESTTDLSTESPPVFSTEFRTPTVTESLEFSTVSTEVPSSTTDVAMSSTAYSDEITTEFSTVSSMVLSTDSSELSTANPVEVTTLDINANTIDTLGAGPGSTPATATEPASNSVTMSTSQGTDSPVTTDYRPRFKVPPTIAPLGTQSSTGTPDRDYFLFAILPNNTVVRKKPSMFPTKETPYLIIGIYPNNTVVRKFPNGTLVPEEPVVQVRGFDTSANPPDITSNQVTPDGNAGADNTSSTANPSQRETTNVAIATTPQKESDTTISVTSTSGTQIVSTTGAPITTTFAPTTANIISTTGGDGTGAEVTSVTTVPTTTGAPTVMPSTTAPTTTSSPVTVTTTPTPITTDALPSLNDLLGGRIIDTFKGIVAQSTTPSKNLIYQTLDVDPLTNQVKSDISKNKPGSGTTIFRWKPVTASESTTATDLNVEDRFNLPNLIPSASTTQPSIAFTTPRLLSVTTEMPTTVVYAISASTDASTTESTTLPSTTRMVTTTFTSPTTTAAPSTTPAISTLVPEKTTIVQTTRKPTTSVPLSTPTKTTTPSFLSTTFFPRFLTTLFAGTERSTHRTSIKTTTARHPTTNPTVYTTQLPSRAPTTRPTTRFTTPTTTAEYTTRFTTVPTTRTQFKLRMPTTLPTTVTQATTEVPTQPTEPTSPPTRTVPTTASSTIQFTTAKVVSSTLKQLTEEQRKNLETLAQLEKEQAAILNQLSFLTNLIPRTQNKPKTSKPKTAEPNSLNVLTDLVQRQAKKLPDAQQNQFDNLLKQYDLSVTKPATTTVPPTVSYGKSTDAILAAILKEQGIQPTTPRNNLFEQLQAAKTTTLPPIRTTFPPATTVQPGPIMQGLSWLLNRFLPPPQPTRKPSNRPPTDSSPDELLSRQPTRVTPVVFDGYESTTETTYATTRHPRKSKTNNLSREEFALVKQIEAIQKDPQTARNLIAMFKDPSGKSLGAHSKNGPLTQEELFTLLMEIQSIQSNPALRKNVQMILKPAATTTTTSTTTTTTTTTTTPKPTTTQRPRPVKNVELSQDELRTLLLQIQEIQRNPDVAKNLDLSKYLAPTTSTVFPAYYPTSTLPDELYTESSTRVAYRTTRSPAIDSDVVKTSSSSKNALPPVAFRPVKGVADGDPQLRGRLVNAAVSVTRAISQFLGSAIQGAATTFQNLVSSGSRAVGNLSSGSSSGLY